MRKHPVLRNVVMPAALASIVIPAVTSAPSAAAATKQAAPAARHHAVAVHRTSSATPTWSATFTLGHLATHLPVVKAKTHPRPRPAVHHLVSAAQMAAWTKVAICEEGGNWHVWGPVYSGGLGISNVNWIIYGGRQFASSAALATPEQQVAVAMRIQPYAPDQYGCANW